MKFAADNHHSDDIDYICIADISSKNDTDLELNITITDAEVEVNIFCLHEDESNLAENRAASSDILKKDDAIAIPQAKVLTLPSRQLHGIWNSYDCLPQASETYA